MLIWVWNIMIGTRYVTLNNPLKIVQPNLYSNIFTGIHAKIVDYGRNLYWAWLSLVARSSYTQMWSLVSTAQWAELGLASSALWELSALLFLRNQHANSSKIMCVHLILWSCTKRTFKLNNLLNEELVQMMKTNQVIGERRSFFLASSVSCQHWHFVCK